VLLTLLVGALCAGAALGLYLGVERAGRAGVPLALLRAVAWGAVAALLVNPGCRREVVRPVTVLLDGSRSMSESAAEARWRAAVDTARAYAGAAGRILVFGDQPRAWTAAVRPDAPASRLLPALREAAASGGPIAIVTDGEIDDAASLPSDIIRAAHVTVLPRSRSRDAAVAALLVPAALRSGDTARATVDVVARGFAAADSAVLELREGARVAARARVGLASGSARVELSFVPAGAAAEREVRRYEARLVGAPGDGEPRNDRLSSAAAVTRAAAIVLVSTAPDWDFRWLTTTLAATAGAPVRAFAAVGQGRWMDTRTQRPVGQAAIEAEEGRAALVVAHGTEEGVRAAGRVSRRALWNWITAAEGPTSGDWYVMPAEAASPIGAALAGVATDSLPPLEGPRELARDSAGWTGLSAQQDRRGRSLPVIVGSVHAGRRTITVAATGLWRWATKGGVAAEGYRSLVAAATDWLLEDEGRSASDVRAQRDSLARGAAELLPRPLALAPRVGQLTARVVETEPLRHRPWIALVAVGALVLEWIARRRVGLR
jgi:hypothetical protein